MSGEHKLGIASIPPGDDASLDRLAEAIDSYARSAEQMNRRSRWIIRLSFALVLLMEGRNFWHDRQIAAKLSVPQSVIQDEVRALSEALVLLRENQDLVRAALNTNAKAAAESASAGAALVEMETTTDTASRQKAATKARVAAQAAQNIVRIEALPDAAVPR